MNISSKAQWATSQRTSALGAERLSLVPPSVSCRGNVQPEHQRESGELIGERGPMSSSRSHCPESHVRVRSRLLETPYCIIDWDRQHNLLRFTRTETPYPSTAVIDHEAMEIERALERASGVRLLVDLRLAAPRNDPEFEAAIKGFRRKVFDRAERGAVVVRTAVGALQVKRHMREDGHHVEVFQSEEEAMSYLDSAGPDSSARITALPPTPKRWLSSRGE